MVLKHSKKSLPFRRSANGHVSVTVSLAVGLGGVLWMGAAGQAWAQTAPPEAPPTGLPTPAVPALPPTPVAPPANPDPIVPLPTNTTVVPVPYSVSSASDKDKNGPKTDKSKRDGKKDGNETGEIRPKSTAEKMFGPVAKDLIITGGMSLSKRSDSVTGGEIATQTYSEQNVNTLDQRSLGPFQNNMDMTITGRVFNAFNVNARLSNSRYGNQFNQVFGVNYKAKGTTLDLGNVNAALPGNSLVTFSRSLEGIVASRNFGKIGKQTVSTTGIASLTRAVTRKGSFQGNGTTGPFYMNASSLREGSEIVRLNGQDLQRDKDYRIDYLLGQITFLAGRIINTGDTVEFSYEAQNYNTSPGLLTGTRIDVGGPGGVGYGLTYLQQKTYQNHVSGSGTVSEYFPVVADLNQHYQLNSLIDNSLPVRAFYRDRQLAEGIDYTVNRDLRYLILKTAFTPDTAQNLGTLTSLRIEYKPIRQSSANGDRSIVGFDTVQRISQNGTVNLQFGQSQSEAAAQKGQAMTLSTAWHSSASKKGGKWTATAGMKNVGLGFSPIESVASAFLQAEKGGDLGFTFAPNEFLDVSTNVRQSKVANVYTSTSTSLAGTTNTTPVWVTNQSLSSSLNFRPKGDLPIMSLTHSQTGQNSGQTTGSRSTYSSDAFNARWSKGILGLDGALTRTATQGRSIFSSAYNNSVSSTTLGGGLLGSVNDGTFSQSVNNSSSTSSRLQASVNPALGHGMTLGMTGEIGFSNTRNGSANNGSQTSGSLARARNTGFGLSFAPLQTLSLTTSWNESSNGQSTAGYYNSSAASSTTGVLASQITNTLTGQKTRSTNYGLQYAPSPRLSFGYVGSRSLSLVPGYDNSQNVASNWNLAGTPFAKLQLGFNVSDQKVSYVGGQGNSANKSTTLTGTIGPFGKLSLTTQIARMNYNSATYNSFGGSTGVGGGTGSGTIVGIGDNTGTGTGTSIRSVPLGRAGTIGLPATSGYTTGYLQNGTNTSWSVQTEYSIGGNKSLFARWDSVDQGAPSSTPVGEGTGGQTGSTYHSASNYRQGLGTVGLELRLTEVVGFALKFNVLNQHDRDDSRYSYHARTFNADLTARF